MFQKLFHKDKDHTEKSTPTPSTKSSGSIGPVNSDPNIEDYGGKIMISRSDGKKHDIVSVMANTNINHVMNNEKAAEKKIQAEVEEEHHNRISISRSDGVTHDIIKVFKGQSDACGDTLTLKSGSTRNPSIEFNKSMSSSLLKDSAFYLKSVRIVHMTDTHNFLKKGMKTDFLPHGHILVHTGNFTNEGKDEEFAIFNDWLDYVRDLYHYRVVILGKREVKIYGNNWDAMKKLLTNATHVLCHDEATILGIRFYGAPWHWAHKLNYILRPGAPVNASARFDDIPTGINVLLTHGPAYDRLDVYYAGDTKDHWGSRELAEALRRVRPSVHLHGQVKDSRGIIPAFGNLPLTINSAMCDKDATVMYATAHVVKATYLVSDSNKNSASWSFTLDTLND